MTRVFGIGRRMRDLPIRQKLRIAFILTTGFALALAGLGITGADAIMFYRRLRSDLTTFVNIIGDNSSGALAFGDPKAGTETLTALRAKRHVEIACLFNPDGSLFAVYRRPGSERACRLSPTEDVHFEHGMLVASHPIMLADRRLGVLVIDYDLGEMVDRSVIYGATVLAALMLSCIAAIAFSTRLRDLIAEPILQLAGTARAVSESTDYSIRAQKFAEDELGTLADALNQMMDVIQSRNNDLHAALSDERVALARLAELNAELQRSNTQLERSIADLGRSNSDLERFAFMASHDLQEPLRMITAYSQLLVEEHARGGERPAEFVKYIVGGTKRMRELLADLLAYTEISGSVESPAEVVELDVVVRRVRDTLHAGIEETKAEVIAEDLPVILAHHGRMISVFQNLVANAIKYRADSPPRIQITVTSDGEEFEFAVKDNGIGIRAEYQQKIFIAFQRLHGKEIPGTGIGLAICQRVVERYGGRIWVESELGTGSTFRFTLPKSMAHEATE